jgi:hypothetical protein
MRLQCEKKGDPGCQSKEMHPTSMRLQYELIGNGLYSLLPIRQRSVMQPVTNRALIGNGLYKPVTDRFNICNELF